jgi:hypothetical protein
VELHAFSTLPLDDCESFLPFVTSPLPDTAPGGRQGRSELLRRRQSLAPAGN